MNACVHIFISTTYPSIYLSYYRRDFMIIIPRISFASAITSIRNARFKILSRYALNLCPFLLYTYGLKQKYVRLSKSYSRTMCFEADGEKNTRCSIEVLKFCAIKSILGIATSQARRNSRSGSPLDRWSLRWSHTAFTVRPSVTK